VSPPPPGNGDPLAGMVAGHPDHPAAGGTATSGVHGPSAAAHRVTGVRLPQEPDYRLRSLSAEPADHVPAAATRTDNPRRRRRGPLLARVAVLLAVAAVAALLLPAFVIQPFAVPGNGMAPALLAGDRMLVVKSGLLAGPVRGGQIVVVRPPRFLPCTVAGGHSGDLVLRVVAVPGQTISSIGQTIFVDGRPLRERGWYDPRFGQVGSTPIRSTALALGHYFVLADNRLDACDSRVFGPISKSSIVGEGVAIVARHGHVFLRRL